MTTIHAPQTKSKSRDQVVAAATHEIDRSRAEISLLAAVADHLVTSFRLLGELGITVDDFASPDTLALFLALRRSAEPEQSRSRIDVARRCRILLRSVGCWDDADERSFIGGGSRWGPGPLAVLLTRVPFDPLMIRREAAVLIAFREPREVRKCA